MSARYGWFSRWVDLHLALTVTLARSAGLTDGEMFAAFGADLGTVRRRTFDDADENPDEQCVRIGQRNGWRFAIEHFSLVGTGDEALSRLSRGNGDAYSLACNVDLCTFQSSHDGRTTTRFDVSMPDVRYGEDPNRYRDQVKTAGLAAAESDRVAGGAYLVQLVTGFELDADMLEAAMASAVLSRTL